MIGHVGGDDCQIDRARILQDALARLGPVPDTPNFAMMQMIRENERSALRALAQAVLLQERMTAAEERARNSEASIVNLKYIIMDMNAAMNDMKKASMKAMKAPMKTPMKAKKAMNAPKAMKAMKASPLIH
jgi:hypothetical protein